MQNVSNKFASNLFLGLLLLTLFVMYFHRITAITQDLGRHLLTGKIIVTTHQIPQTNLYSYTFPDFPFHNHHWLSEVVFYRIHALVGFPGLLLITTLCVILAFFLLFNSGRKTSSFLVMAGVSIPLFRVLSERTDLRPELFSFLFLSLFLVILFAYRERPTRWLYLLPLLEVLWVNMHIYFLVGLIAFGLFALDRLIVYRKKLTLQNHSSFFLVFFLTCLTTLLNPEGLKGALYPLSVFSNYGYTIEENQNIFFLQSLFNKPTILFFEVSVVLLFLVLTIAWRKTRPIDWFLAGTFTILGAMAIRNFPLFVFAVFLPFSRSLSITLRRFEKTVSPLHSRTLRYALTGTLLLLLMWQMRESAAKYPVTSRLDPGAEKAVSFLTSHQLNGPHFNNFDIGSYLEYRLYPKEKVFVDGRPEAYPASFFQDTYIPMQQDPTVFSKMANKYHFTTIVFSHTDQTPWAESFLGFITKDPAWKTVLLDENMIILRRSDLAKSLPTISDTTPSTLPTDKLALQKYAHFYSVASWPTHLQATLQALLQSDPSNCQVLYNLAILTWERNDPTSSLYAGQYISRCR